MVIEVKGLTKQFKGINAVNDLSFGVRPGEVYGFIGQNGAGKSTTIRMLLTLIKATSGEIRIFDKPLQTNRIEILRNTGAVIEKPDLYQYLTGIQNLALFAKLNGLRLTKKELLDKLDEVGLAKRASDKVKVYSQGMKQRLGIAVAIVHNPDLIILDEPTNGLDPQGIVDIRNLILQLSREKKKTVFISSHLLSEVEQIADSLLVIDKGTKVVEGPVKTLIDPEQVLLEFETTDNLKCLQWLMQSQWKDFLTDQSSSIISMKMKRRDIPVLVKQTVEQGIGILMLKPMNALEQYFLSLTNGASK
jgi:ABC-type multidrug transport system ATPase subunit